MLYIKYIEMKTSVLLVVLLLLVPLIGKAQDDTITIGRENNMTKNSKVYQKTDDETLRSILSAEQYAVIQRNATCKKNGYYFISCVG